MQKKTRSLLEELEAIGQRDSKHLIENRAQNVIASAIHLLELIQRNFDAEQSAVLERKLLNAIKSRDTSRFSRSLRKQDNED